MRLWEWVTILYHLHGCRVYEDLSAWCGQWGYGVPW